MQSSKKTKKGVFVISLDFELMWGVRDKKTIDSYGEEILNGKQAIPEMLSLFHRFNVKSTYATVGFLFHKDIEELKKEFPRDLPNYTNEILDPYRSVQSSTKYYETYHPYYFCPELIQQITETEAHEIATHTYSHYYCLEEGQSIKEFEADIVKAKEVAKAQNIELKKISSFPGINTTRST